MGLADLKKELKKLEKDQIIELVADLYKANKSAQEFLDFYVNPDERALFEKYRQKVIEAFFPKRGFGYTLSEEKKAISDFKKLSPSGELLAELMLVYVESGVRFTAEFGDIDMPFYSSLEKTYDAALLLMKKEKVLQNFALRAREIVDRTRHFGWGFHDTLSESYWEYYGEDS